MVARHPMESQLLRCYSGSDMSELYHFIAHFKLDVYEYHAAHGLHYVYVWQ